MKLACCKTRGGCVAVLIVGGLIIAAAAFWAGRLSVSDPAPPPASPDPATRLVTNNYWRLANWEQLDPGLATDPNPAGCGPDQFSRLETSGPLTGPDDYSCVDRPEDPGQTDEEVVESLKVEALDRFNVDTKPRAMRIVSSYVQPRADFPYRPTTPETCRRTWTNRVADTIRAEIDLGGPFREYFRPEMIGDYTYIISEGCGDWVLDVDALADNYGGAFFYQDAPSRFNVDSVDIGIRPVHELNYPTRFSYRPTTPETCRYYLIDSSFSRAGVDRLFEDSAVDGQRGFGFAQNIDIGGWYDYGSSPVEITTGHGYTFMISEGCGDWTRDDWIGGGVEEPPAKNQIFDHPYWSGPFTYDN